MGAKPRATEAEIEAAQHCLKDAPAQPRSRSSATPNPRRYLYPRLATDRSLSTRSRAAPTATPNFSCEARTPASKSAAIAQNLRLRRTCTDSAVRLLPGRSDSSLPPQKYAGLVPKLAPEPRLAIDAFARVAGGQPKPLPPDVQFGIGIGQRAKPSREADVAARSGQFTWSAIAGAARRARFLSLSLDRIGGRTNSDRDSALSGEGLGAQQVASSCRTSCRTSTAAPSGTASAVPGAGIVGAGDAGGGVVLSASKDGTIRTVKRWLTPG